MISKLMSSPNVQIVLKNISPCHLKIKILFQLLGDADHFHFDRELLRCRDVKPRDDLIFTKKHGFRIKFDDFGI